MSNDENHTELEQSLREAQAAGSRRLGRIRSDLAGRPSARG